MCDEERCSLKIIKKLFLIIFGVLLLNKLKTVKISYPLLRPFRTGTYGEGVTKFVSFHMEVVYKLASCLFARFRMDFGK